MGQDRGAEVGVEAGGGGEGLIGRVFGDRLETVDGVWVGFGGRRSLR